MRIPIIEAVAFLLGSALSATVEPGAVINRQVFHDDDSAQAHLLMGSILLL